MAGSLNLRNVSGVSELAQGDDASTIVLELQDENKLFMPSLSGYDATVRIVDEDRVVFYEYETFVFDGRVEFNITKVLPAGKYIIELEVFANGSTYVFPSNMRTRLRINKSTLGVD